MNSTPIKLFARRVLLSLLVLRAVVAAGLAGYGVVIVVSAQHSDSDWESLAVVVGWFLILLCGSVTLWTLGLLAAARRGGEVAHWLGHVEAVGAVVLALFAEAGSGGQLVGLVYGAGFVALWRFAVSFERDATPITVR